MAQRRCDPRRPPGSRADDIVSYTTYAVAGHDLAQVMAARDAFLGGHRAASTLVPVPALARPEWKVEVAVVAARSSAASDRIRT